MADYTFKNFATSTIAGGASGVGTNLLNTDTAVYVQTGDGTKYSGASSSAPGYILFGTVTGTHELCSYTGVTGDQLTGLTRGLEGTTAQTWATTTSVQSILTAGVLAHALFDDGGKLSTDGAGNLTAIKFIAAPTAVGAGTPTLYDFKPSGANVNKEWIILYNGATGALQFYDQTDSANALTIAQAGITVPGTLAVTGSSSLDNGKLTSSGAGAINKLNNLAMAGSYGVPGVVAVGKDVVISNTTATTIATWTSPTGVTSLVRVSAHAIVGGGNTNSGIITMATAYNNGLGGGAITTNFYNEIGNAISGFTVGKGVVINVYSKVMEVSSNTAVTITYQNTAAGTISDKCSACIEVLG